MAHWILYEFALDNGETYEVPREEEPTEHGATGASKSAPGYIAGVINDAKGYVMVQRLDNGAPADYYTLIPARHITRVSWELLNSAPAERSWRFR